MDRWVLSRNSLDCGVLSIFFPLDDFVQRCREMKSASADELSSEKEKSGADEKESHLLSLPLRAERAAGVYQSMASRSARCARDRQKEKKANCHTRRDDDFISKTTHAQTHFCKSDALQMDEFFWLGHKVATRSQQQPLFQFRAASIIARLISECYCRERRDRQPGPPSPLSLFCG